MRWPSPWPLRGRLLVACLILALLPLRGAAMALPWAQALTQAVQAAAANAPHAQGAHRSAPAHSGDTPCHAAAGTDAQGPHHPTVHAGAKATACPAAAQAGAGGEHDCGQCQVCHSPAAAGATAPGAEPTGVPERPHPRLRLAQGRVDGDTLFRPPRG